MRLTERWRIWLAMALLVYFYKRRIEFSLGEEGSKVEFSLGEEGSKVEFSVGEKGSKVECSLG